MAGTDLIAYVESMPGARKSAGSEWQVNCPFCGRRQHLYVNVEEGEGWDGKPKPAGRWICFGCGQSSMQFERLLAEAEGISVDAARNMMGHWRAGGFNWKRPSAMGKPEVPRASWLPPEFEPVTKVWPKYLTERGIPRKLAAEFNLGICRTGDFAHRIILPIDCPLGRDFQARAIRPDMQPRYLSGPDCGQLIFGWHTIAESDFAVLVEGPFDALSLARAGYPVGALMGTSLRDGQAELLKQRRRRYVVMLDPLSKDPNAVDKACDIAWKLGGLVGNNLDAESDPGDERDKGVIDRWINSAIEPREALNRALQARITRQRR
jgi:hypothetical protein